MDQTKNTGIMVEYLKGAVRSGVSGAMRRPGEAGQIGFSGAGRYDTSGRIVDASGKPMNSFETPWKADFGAMSPQMMNAMKNATRGAGTGLGGQARALGAQTTGYFAEMAAKNRSRLGSGATAMGSSQGLSVVTGATVGKGASGKVTVPNSGVLGGSGLNINVNINVDDVALKKAFTATVDIGAPKTSRPYGG